MISSRHYQPKLPAWVEAFNAERLVHACFGRTWDRLLDPALYDRVQGPDDATGEGGRGLGRTFPKIIDGGRKTIGPDFFTAFDVAPFTTEILADFAQRAIREEQLGEGGFGRGTTEGLEGIGGDSKACGQGGGVGGCMFQEPQTDTGREEERYRGFRPGAV